MISRYPKEKEAHSMKNTPHIDNDSIGSQLAKFLAILEVCISTHSNLTKTYPLFATMSIFSRATCTCSEEYHVKYSEVLIWINLLAAGQAWTMST